MEQHSPLSGRVVLLTGANGLAATVTRELLAGGARVAVAGPAADPGTRGLALPCDPDDPAALSRAIGTVVDRLGRLDHLVNLVTVRHQPDPLMELDPLALRGVLHEGLVAPLAWTQRAYWHWMAEHGGTVVNVVADVVHDGPQAAALAALTELTEWMAAEMAPRVDVHTILPGPSLDSATYRAGIVDALADLLSHPRSTDLGGLPRNPVHGPVLVLTGQCVRPCRAA